MLTMPRVELVADGVEISGWILGWVGRMSSIELVVLFMTCNEVDPWP